MEINDNSRRTYKTNSHVKFKTSILSSVLCDFSDVNKLVKKAITHQRHHQQQTQVIMIKKWYLKIVFHLWIP